MKNQPWSLYTTAEDDEASRRLAKLELQEVHLPQTRENSRDGSLLRLIPAGEFTMGSAPSEDGGFQAESPQFRVGVPAFYLAVHAVTNEQFARFLNEVRPAPDRLQEWLPHAGLILPSPASDGSYRIEAGYERHPVAQLSWFGADAYSRWAGLRLPTEIEWEKAARGTDGRIFPWGNDWDESRLRWHGGDRQEGETTAPVDAYVDGSSPFGCFQMAGNVEEWCQDHYQADAYARYATGDLRAPSSGRGRVIRGGSFNRCNPLEFRCATRRSCTALPSKAHYTGLRCASSELLWTLKR